MDEITALRMRIERTERRLRLVVAALAVSVSALSVVAFTHPAVSQQSPQYLRVRGLTVVDDTGRDRITLLTSGIQILTEAGEPGFEAYAAQRLAYVQIREASGRSVRLVINPAGATVSANTSDDRTFVNLGVTPYGPFVTLTDRDRTVFNAP
jgi:hypothetical protein